MNAPVGAPDDRRLKIWILGASLSATNLGVGALTADATRCIFEQHPDADVFLLDYGREPVVFEGRGQE